MVLYVIWNCRFLVTELASAITLYFVATTPFTEKEQQGDTIWEGDEED
jgi:hypothetical protein